MLIVKRQENGPEIYIQLPRRLRYTVNTSSAVGVYISPLRKPTKHIFVGKNIIFLRNNEKLSRQKNLRNFRWLARNFYEFMTDFHEAYEVTRNFRE